MSPPTSQSEASWESLEETLERNCHKLAEAWDKCRDAQQALERMLAQYDRDGTADAQFLCRRELLERKAAGYAEYRDALGTQRMRLLRQIDQSVRVDSLLEKKQQRPKRPWFSNKRRNGHRAKTAHHHALLDKSGTLEQRDPPRT